MLLDNAVFMFVRDSIKFQDLFGKSMGENAYWMWSCQQIATPCQTRLAILTASESLEKYFKVQRWSKNKTFSNQEFECIPGSLILGFSIRLRRAGHSTSSFYWVFLVARIETKHRSSIDSTNPLTVWTRRCLSDRHCWWTPWWDRWCLFQRYACTARLSCVYCY